jgi:multiple antibiotic resistance protein
MPLLAGPGSISLLINLSLQTDIFVDKAAVIAAILAVCIGIYVTLLSAPFILKYIGQGGLRTLSKIMGLIVLSIGIQMIVDSLHSMFN